MEEVAAMISAGRTPRHGGRARYGRPLVAPHLFRPIGESFSRAAWAGVPRRGCLSSCPNTPPYGFRARSDRWARLLYLR